MKIHRKLLLLACFLCLILTVTCRNRRIRKPNAKSAINLANVRYPRLNEDPEESSVRLKRQGSTGPPANPSPPSPSPASGPGSSPAPTTSPANSVLPPRINLTGDDTATDKACLKLHPCEAVAGEHEHEMKEYCWKFLNDDNADHLTVKCYDADPEPEPTTDDEVVPVTKTTPKDMNDGYDGVGFKIPNEPVFRYSKFFDIDDVGDKYYKDSEGALEFELLDWPGLAVNSYIAHAMEKRSKGKTTIWAVAECMQVLEFEGRSNKYLDYICNDAEGLDITALGLIGTTKPPREEDLPESCPITNLDLPLNEDDFHDDDDYYDNKDNSTETTTEAAHISYNRVYNLRCNLPRNRDHPGAKCVTWPVPSGKLYLAYGGKALMKDYIQPMLIPEDILRRLAQDGSSQDPIPTFGNEQLQCSHFESRDIRTVLDFAFASDRLILGMKCGVILVKEIASKHIKFDVAYLKISDRQRDDPDKSASHVFPYMINIVAAAPCCTTNKMCSVLTPLVAVYSSYAAYYSYPDDDKFYRDILPKTIYISTDNGDTFDRRVVASPDAAINLMYWMYAKIPKWQMKNTRPPEWINQRVFKELPELGEEFQEPINPITKFVMQGVLPSEAGADGSECHEIVSMAPVSEEKLLLVLCRYKNRHTANSTSSNAQANTYAIFSVPIRGNIPLITFTRRSERKFSCKPMPMQRIWDKFEGVAHIEPYLVRIPDSYSIFILGCEKIIYFSSNGGKTLFLRSFFYNDTEAATDGESDYVFTRSNKYLTNYPMVAIDPEGQRVVFTFGRHFAYGLTSSSTDATFICGPVLDKLPTNVQTSMGDPVFLPYFDDSGRAEVGVLYADMLKKTGKTFFTENYEERYGIRLLNARITIHGHALPFYQEYAGTKDTDFNMSPCTTYAFKINASSISLDVGQSAAIQVSVKDNRKDVPLSVVLTHDKAASLRVVSTSTVQKEDGLMQHEWVIEITAKPYVIPPDIARVDAFFGAAYSNLEEVMAHLIISTQPQLRCHVQPRGHVAVRFGCNKYLAVHEDARRPQCAQFMNNFRYEIPHGHYDPDLAEYWKSERPKFYNIENGTLKITYDYEMFGCPVEPYRLDDYMPDLRLLPIGGAPNTSAGEVFKGRFVLVEVFGATGYSFKQKVRGMNCTVPPQTLEEMIQEWRVRVEAMKAIWYDYPHFDFDNVYAPINIWNPVNYVPCQNEDEASEESDEEEPANEDDDPHDLGAEVLDSPYETLTLDAPEEQWNKITWDPAFRQRVYIFLAVGVDPYNSYCTYNAYVPVSLAVPKEESDVILILVFFGTLVVLLLIIVAGYYVRRYQVYKKFYKEAMFNRLLTAAWNLSFRYEKILLDSKITDPVVKQQVEETRRLKHKRHSGLDNAKGQRRNSNITEVRQRIRQT